MLRPRTPLPELAARSPLARDGDGLFAGFRGGLVEFGDAVTAATVDVPKLRDVRRHGAALLLGLHGTLGADLEMDVLVRDERYRRR